MILTVEYPSTHTTTAARHDAHPPIVNTTTFFRQRSYPSRAVTAKGWPPDQLPADEAFLIYQPQFLARTAPFLNISEVYTTLVSRQIEMICLISVYSLQNFRRVTNCISALSVFPHQIMVSVYSKVFLEFLTTSKT